MTNLKVIVLLIAFVSYSSLVPKDMTLSHRFDMPLKKKHRKFSWYAYTSSVLTQNDSLSY
jgi:hypothetical protein